MKVLVCGGRNYNDFSAVDRVLSHLNPTCIVQGGANGADKLALMWARRNGVSFQTFEAEWDKYGPSAGPRRNQQMLENSKPDLVVSFPGGRGTEDMVGRAKRAGVKVMQVEQ